VKIQAVSGVAAGRRVALYLHYDDITIIVPSGQPSPSSARNQLTGKVVGMFPFASQMKITLDCGFNIASVITRRSCEELGLEKGREIIASFKASAVHIILNAESDDGQHILP